MPTLRVEITQRIVREAVAAIRKRQYEVADTLESGFRIRVRATTAVWTLKGRWQNPARSDIWPIYAVQPDHDPEVVREICRAAKAAPHAKGDRTSVAGYLSMLREAPRKLDRRPTRRNYDEAFFDVAPGYMHGYQEELRRREDPWAYLPAFGAGSRPSCRMKATLSYCTHSSASLP